MHDNLSRRRFVATGLSVSAAASVGAAASVSGIPSNHAPANCTIGLQYPLHLALIDTRFPAAKVFGRTMGLRGVTLARYDGDVTPIWFHKLDPVWRQHPLAVAGLTTEGALFCLEQMAWDYGMRVAYRGFHHGLPDGGVQHLLESSARRPQDVKGRISGLQPWPEDVAELIARIDEPTTAFPSDPQGRSQANYRTRSRSTATEPHLVSWLIAPKNWRSPAVA